PSTGFDVAFLLLEKLTSLENVQQVKNLIGFN
ncbi:DJ-1 family protein, partial [Priestia megaterium]